MKNGVPTTVLVISAGLVWLRLAEPDRAALPALSFNRLPATSLASTVSPIIPAPMAAGTTVPARSTPVEAGTERRPESTTVLPAPTRALPPDDHVASATVEMTFDTSVAPPPPDPRLEPPVAPPTATAAPVTGDVTRDDEEAVRAREISAIQQVLARYKRMYDELDVSQATAIWPAVDSRSLSRMFSRLDRQTLEFDGCVFALWDNGAAANCTGWLSYVPRFGNASLRREPHSWTIELERGGEGWQIAKVIAR